MDMKASLLTPFSLLFLFFLLLSFSPKPSNASSPVLDIDGHKLQTGVSYYILPVVRGRGGGLTLGASRSGTCPLAVVQEQHEVSNGLPVRFSPADAGAIRLLTDLNIWFEAATICVQSTAWRLAPYNGISKQYFVMSGGVLGNPGRETVSNWFKIEKMDKDYKLVFCPAVCDTCKVICRDVGVYLEGVTRRLALSDEPFRVQFKKA
ncbi:kunitz trypsin inhibitor 5-like [Rhodamnia argentea]|uniref:Kunitz trypsin inhibitor 5-like n=1 Tax=Rhodamnia argentea TaxID=178133 RepID=A0A8B8NGK5_9MYRT|nr:kunitz trypsin inhibitor 5-like [Rhodamnia argentea]